MTPLRNELFNSRLALRFFGFYRKIFSIEELEENRVLQWAFGAILFAYFVAFSSWTNDHATTLDAFYDGTYRCWPYFQECGKLLFLRALPEGYSQTFFYMMLFGMLTLTVYLIHRKDWVLAHMSLLVPFAWHIFAAFILTGALAGNYDYYLAVFAIIIFFLPHKEFFLKLALVFLYFLSTSAKIHPAWVLGTYFSAMKEGLPLFPDWSIPIWTNTVMLMEMVGSWFLISRIHVLQRGILFFFVAFHLYSGILVEYHYPATVLPMLLILFGPLYRYKPIPFDAKAIFGWIFIAILFLMQMLPLAIPGDEKLTLEGNRFGLYMFESNHQCVSTTTVYYRDGTEKIKRRESISARSRCEPYRYWFEIHAACTAKESNIERVAWTFDHSINGGPFLRIVDVPDACALTYLPFSHNLWIRTEKDNPPIIGYPVENLYD